MPTIAQVMMDLLGRRFWITAYLALIIGVLIPGAHPEWSVAVPVVLGGILFFTGLRLPWGEITAAARSISRWRLALILGGIQLGLMPLLAWALTRLVAPDWAGGVLLVAMMPAGLSSIAYTDLFKGDRALALLLVVATSLATPITVPLGLQWFGPDHAQVDLTAMAGRAGYILMLLCIPLAASQLLRAAAPGPIHRHHRLWGMLAVACSCVLGGVAVVTTKTTWLPLAWVGLLWPLLLTCCASALFVVLSLGIRRWLSPPEAVAFACGAVYMNNGLSVAFAVRFFPDSPAMLLPSVLMMIPMVASTAIIGRCLRP